MLLKFPGYLQGTSRVPPGYLQGTSRVPPGYLQGTSRVPPGYLQGTSRVPGVLGAGSREFYSGEVTLNGASPLAAWASPRTKTFLELIGSEKNHSFHHLQSGIPDRIWI